MVKRFWVFSLIMILLAPAHARVLGFQAIFKDPDGELPPPAEITVHTQILDPSGHCLLRGETHYKVPLREGHINISLGSPAAETPASHNPTPILSLKDALDNDVAVIQGLNCTYTPAPTDIRKLRVQTVLTRHNGSRENIDVDFDLQAVAYALNTAHLNGKTEKDFAQFNPAKGLTPERLEELLDRVTTLENLLENTHSTGYDLDVDITGQAATAGVASVAQSLAGGIEPLLPAQTGAQGKTLETNGSGALSWKQIPFFGGTVSEVELLLPGVLFNSVTPQNGNGTLQASFKTQVAKHVFAAPEAGAGSPEFRPLNWNEILGFGSFADDTAAAKISAATGIAGGIAPLNGTGLLAHSNLPATATLDTSLSTSEFILQDPPGPAVHLAAPASGVSSHQLALPEGPGLVGEYLKIESQAGGEAALTWGPIPNAGTLTLLGINLPTSIFAGTGSPVATVGTIAYSLKSQPEKTVFSAPTTGAGLPSFRQLEVADFADAKTAILYDVPLSGDAGTNQVLLGNDSRLGNARVPANNSVTAAKISANAVTDAKIVSLDSSKLTGTIPAANLPAASASADGIVTQLAQSFAGVKTFLDNVIAQGTLSVTGATSAASLSTTGEGRFGYVKVANPAATCDSAMSGALKYNFSTKRMEFCNGTAWGTLPHTHVTVSVSGPSTGLVRSGPVTFTVTYGGDVNLSTVSLTAGNISFGGTAPSGCSVTSVSGAGATRTITVNNCTGTGTVSISLAAATAQSNTGNPAPNAGPSSTFQADNTGPNAPASVTLGAVPANTTTSPTITYPATTDVGGSSVSYYQAQIVRVSDGAVMRAWNTHTSGSAITGLGLAMNTAYYAQVRAVDALGNPGTVRQGTWTTYYDACVGTPAAGTNCYGGAKFLGSTGGAKYMTTPGGCQDVPGGAGVTGYTNSDFTVSCSGGTDYVEKAFGSATIYNVPALADLASGSNNDPNTGLANTTALAANPGGIIYAAAKYCHHLVYGGYSDWALPNTQEMTLLYNNRTAVGGINMSDQRFYLTSSESDGEYSWQYSPIYQLEWGGDWWTMKKHASGWVRCVRRY